MAADAFYFEARDGARLFVRRWLPEGRVRAIVQIVHGLAEHSGRYQDFAEALNRAGVGAYAGDLRGHGRSAEGGALGFFAPKEGWRRCLDDLADLNRHVASVHPATPIILFGHSMGSFLAQNFVAERGDRLAGAIFSGSNGRPPAIAALGRLIARIERLRLGPKGKSALLKSMWFGAFNKPFEPARTVFDWLSRDPAAVDAYVADPLCGFDFTTQLAVDVLDALPSMLAPENVARIPTSLPILIVSGSRDPVGPNIENLVETYRKAGLHPKLRLYPDGRHEMLNEINREAVKADIVGWIGGVIEKTEPIAASA